MKFVRVIFKYSVYFQEIVYQFVNVVLGLLHCVTKQCLLDHQQVVNSILGHFSIDTSSKLKRIYVVINLLLIVRHIV